MKKIIFLSAFLLIFFLTGPVLLSGCGGSATPSLTEQQKATKALTQGSPWGGTGRVEVIDVPTGVDPSGLSALAIVFSSTDDPTWEPTTIETFGANEFLSTSNSTWAWSGTGETVITLTNASSSELTGVNINGQVLTITFEVNSGGGTGARTAGLDGTYTVKLQNNGNNM